MLRGADRFQVSVNLDNATPVDTHRDDPAIFLMCCGIAPVVGGIHRADTETD